ncbi:MAG: helix-turn-helix domain-containing protein [Burkholderia sp.]
MNGKENVPATATQKTYANRFLAQKALSLRAIARKLNRAPLTLSHELACNTQKWAVFVRV